MKNMIFWDVTPCSLVEVYRCFGGIYCLFACSSYSSILKVEEVRRLASTRLHIPEDSTAKDEYWLPPSITEFSAIANCFTELLLLKILHTLKQQLTEARVYTVVVKLPDLSKILEQYSMDHRPPLVVLPMDKLLVHEVSVYWDE
jgi:hypothetical protein